MQIRMDPKRLRRRVELARIKARSHEEREWLLYQVEYREAKRLDAKEEEARRGLSSKERLAQGYLFSMSHVGALYRWRMPCPQPNNLDKYERLCNKADDFVEINEQEWAEIERWRLAPFASHPSNAEAFPEIAPSPPDCA